MTNFQDKANFIWQVADDILFGAFMHNESRDVVLHLSDAWMDRSKDKIGYEINFTKYFYKFTSLRSLADIKADILPLEEQTEGLLKGGPPLVPPTS